MNGGCFCTAILVYMSEVLSSILVFLLSFLGGGSASTEEAGQSKQYPQEVIAEVVRVLDGDTIDVRIDGVIERVRYIGIDTPELRTDGRPECYSTEATVANRSLIAGKRVRLEADEERRDDYDRLLRYVYVGDTFVNAELLQGGYARLLFIPPNTREYGDFREIRDEAREEGRGLWSACE